jgi:hypothetical protein
MIKYILESTVEKGYYLQDYTIDNNTPVIGDNILEVMKFDSEERAKRHVNKYFKIVKADFSYKIL